MKGADSIVEKKTDAESAHTSSRTDGPTISLIIPTLNEEAGIEECIHRAQRGFDDLGMSGEVIVSDSSTDQTPRKAKQLGARVVKPDKPGYGYAYLYGFEHVRGDIIVIGDGDTTYDFAELPRFIEEIKNGADIVMGSRFDGEMEVGAMPWLHRRVGNPFLTKFLNIFYQMDVSDAHTGFRVFTREALEAIDPDTTGMEFASEMLIRAKAAELDIREVPITYHRRKGEATLDSFRDGWRHLRFLIANAPGEVFLLPGTFFILSGLAIMAVVFFDIPPLAVMSTNSMTAGSLLTLLGSHVVALGVFSMMARNPIQNPRRLISPTLTNWFTIERGIGLGLALSGIGSVSAIYLLQQWLISGFDAVPSPNAGILAMTLIALGLQTVFQMFFISLLKDVDAYD